MNSSTSSEASVARSGDSSSEQQHHGQPGQKQQHHFGAQNVGRLELDRAIEHPGNQVGVDFHPG
ncbi:MAG: hypothetical protein M5R42_08110 [Rhodocyclaceae bacterium]|nr:hypothetical protein [Rhodocyclaceae bacterium]